MNVLLVDVDSKIPNLALMKLSAWHKAKGDNVGFNINDPDLIYASVIFKKNRHMIDGLRCWYPNAKIQIGGSGYDLDAKLPHDIEQIKPDYSLYPDLTYSMGFTTRGCIRSCHFCVVPKKEGKLFRAQHPAEFHDEKFSEIMIMDNNWLADREWFMATSYWIIERGLRLRENGMDIRLIDKELAEQIAKFKLAAPLHFAFDHQRDTKAVLDGIEILKAAGIDTHGRVSFYVYCHDDSDYESALARAELLRKHNTSAFIMCNIDKPRSQRMKDLQRWANKPWIFWSIPFSQYKVKA